MRVLGFARNQQYDDLNILDGEEFVTRRFVRKGRDWYIGEIVKVCINQHSQNRKFIGIAQIVDKRPRDMTSTKNWLNRTYGHRWHTEFMSELTLVWIKT